MVPQNYKHNAEHTTDTHPWTDLKQLYGNRRNSPQTQPCKDKNYFPLTWWQPFKSIHPVFVLSTKRWIAVLTYTPQGGKYCMRLFVEKHCSHRRNQCVSATTNVLQPYHYTHKRWQERWLLPVLWELAPLMQSYNAAIVAAMGLSAWINIIIQLGVDQLL